MASEQSPHFFESGFLSIDMVGWRIVFVGSPGNIELAVGDDFVVISFLAQRGEGQRTEQLRVKQFRRNSNSSTHQIIMVIKLTNPQRVVRKKEQVTLKTIKKRTCLKTHNRSRLATLTCKKNQYLSAFYYFTLTNVKHSLVSAQPTNIMQKAMSKYGLATSLTI